MSWTSEHHFKLQWHGLEKVGRVCDHIVPLSYQSTADYSSGEHFQMLVDAVEKTLLGQKYLQDALLNSDITIHELNDGFKSLKYRITHSIENLTKLHDQIDAEWNILQLNR